MPTLFAPKNTFSSHAHGGGIAAIPAYVTGEGEPYRPEALFWMAADGAILGSAMAKPGELLAMASESLQSTIEQPIFGRPNAPTRVRVASAVLADAVRSGHPGIDVVCAPTPELDEMLALMREEMGEGDAAGQSYLSPEVEPDAMASFFKAAAALFRAKPWKLVPDDQCPFSVTIEPLGVRDAALSDNPFLPGYWLRGECNVCQDIVNVTVLGINQLFHFIKLLTTESRIGKSPK